MKSIYRILSLVLVLLMSMAILAGCGKTEEETPAAPAVAEEAVPVDPVVAAPAESSAEIPMGGDAGATTEPPAEFVALDPAGDYSRDWAGYQAYLAEACNAETAFPDDEMRQQVKDQIAAATEAEYDAAAFPYQMLIGMNIAVSYEDFLVA